MAVKPIVQGEQPVLRAVSQPIQRFEKSTEILVQDLLDTMTDASGIGLAAPQIGIPLRVFVLDIGNGPMVFMNPEIIQADGEQSSVESCLSFPGLTYRITRPDHITVKAQNLTGEGFEMEASGLLARVICHETDHLDGVLFFDRLADEELFTQMLQHMLVSESDDEEAHENGVGGQEVPQVDTAMWNEVQLGLDLLADASWKITLAADLLRDHAQLLHDPPEVAQLSDLEAQLGELVERWEEIISSLSDQAID